MPRPTGARPIPLWTKAPVVLLRFPQLFASVAVSACLLIVATSSGALFLSATGSAELNAAIDELDRYSAGYFVAQTGAFFNPATGTSTAFSERDQGLRDASSGINGLGERVVTVYGQPVSASAPGDSPAETEVRLLARTGAADHLQVIEGSAGDGVWIADTTARTLGIGAGDRLTLRGVGPASTIEMRVTGVYRALVNAAPIPYWSPLYSVISPDDPGDEPPAPFAIADREAVIDGLLGLEQQTASIQWDFPLAAGTPLTVPEAQELNGRFTLMSENISDPGATMGGLFSCTDFCPEFGRSAFGSNIGSAINRANTTIAGLDAPIELLSVAGTIAALVVIGAAGIYVMHRRRAEAMFLHARGIGPASIGLKAAVESLLPAVVGVVFGFVAARLIAGWFGGEGAPIAPSAVASAARGALQAIVLTATVFGLAAATSASRETRVWTSRERALPPWEIVLLLVGLALYRIAQQEATLVQVGPNEIPRTSYLALLFPVVLIAAGSGIVSRGFKSIMKSAAHRRRRFRAASYLAVHRIAGATGLAVMLVTAAGLAIGIFVYAQTIVDSIEATTRAKAYVSAGSDSNVVIDRGYVPPEPFPFEHTAVTQVLHQARLVPENVGVYLLVVDADSLADVAFWDESFGADTLSTLMEEATSARGGRLGSVGVGDLPGNATVRVSGADLEVHVSRRVETFPATFSDQPWLVIDDEQLEQAGRSVVGDIWRLPVGLTRLLVKGDPSSVVSALERAGFGRDEILSADSILRRPTFVSVTRAFRFLRTLALLSALIVVIGTVLYLQARQRGRIISYALARRMGLRSRTHLTSLGMELGAMLFTAAVAGVALGLTAAILLYSRIDPLPSMAPTPLLRLAFAAPVALMVVLVAITFAGALFAHRTAERGRVAEQLRQAG